MNRWILICLTVAAGVCLAVAPAESQILSGKMTGVVTDPNGSSLPGANVVVKGTRYGTTADPEGVYVILGVEPGVYEIEASLVGYSTVVRKNVRVVGGRSIKANFTLRETAIQAEEIVVTAKHPLIEVDRTGSETKILKEAIEQVPIIRDVQGHLEHVSGVDVLSARDGGRGYTDDNGIRIRRQVGDTMGSGQTWTLDGMELTILDVGFISNLRQYNNLPVTAISEMAIVKGGIDASQASAVAGVINMVSREGTRAIHGGIDVRIEPSGRRHRGPNIYDAVAGQAGGTNGLWRDKLKWDDPDWVNEVDSVTGEQVHVRQDYEGAIGHLVEGWVSGPLGENTTFFVSGKTSRDKVVFPAPERIGLRQWSIFGKLTHTLADNLKLKIAYNQSNEPKYQGDVRGPGDVLGSTSNLFLVNGFTGYEEQHRNRVVYATVTHAISPRTFQEMQVGFFGTIVDTTDKTPTTSGGWRKDEDGKFNLYRDYRRLYVDNNRRYNLRYDLTSQVTRRNLLRTGFTYQIFNNTNMQFVQNNASRGSIKIIAGGDYLPGERYTAQRFNWYFSDKVEFQGLIVNFGLRYDRLWGGPEKAIGGWYRGQPGLRTYNAFVTRTPRGKMRPLATWSPRIGVSHPLTDRAVLRYSFGLYYKPAMFGQIWGEGFVGTNLKVDPTLAPGATTWMDDTNGTGTAWRMDSTWHNPSGLTNTTEFEAAAEWNFVSDLVLDVGTYFRRVERVTGLTLKRWWDPIQGLLNRHGGNGPHGRFESKGLELSVYKPFSENFSFQTSLDVGWSFYNIASGIGVPRGHYFYPDSTFIASPHYFLTDKDDNPVALTDAQVRDIGHAANEQLKSLGRSLENQTNTRVRTGPLTPLRDYPDFTDEERNRSDIQGIWFTERYLNDQRVRIFAPPVANASFQFLWSTPPDWGPGPLVGGARLLGGIQANLVWRYDSGQVIKFTPAGASTEVSRRGPQFVRTDLNFQKSLAFGIVRPTLYAEVFNLFNSQVDRERSYPGVNYLRWGLYRPAPNDKNLQKFGDPRPFRGGDARYVNLGVRVRF